ncbi:hypothetical protein ACOME3_008149 [Neoechinorhynchus agilis]
MSRISSLSKQLTGNTSSPVSARSLSPSSIMSSIPSPPRPSASLTWMVACSKGDTNAMQRIKNQYLEGNRIFYRQDPFHGYTALHWAFRKGSVPMLKFIAQSLSSNELDELMKVKNNLRRTCLHLGCMYQRKNREFMASISKICGKDKTEIWDCVRTYDIDGKVPLDYMIPRNVAEMQHSDETLILHHTWSTSSRR